MAHLSPQTKHTVISKSVLKIGQHKQYFKLKNLKVVPK